MKRQKWILWKNFDSSKLKHDHVICCHSLTFQFMTCNSSKSMSTTHLTFLMWRYLRKMAPESLVFRPEVSSPKNTFHLTQCQLMEKWINVKSIKFKNLIVDYLLSPIGARARPSVTDSWTLRLKVQRPSTVWTVNCLHNSSRWQVRTSYIR